MHITVAESFTKSNSSILNVRTPELWHVISSPVNICYRQRILTGIMRCEHFK